MKAPMGNWTTMIIGGKVSRIYITSDLHLGHKLISGLRGFNSLEEHDEHVLDTLNSMVSPKDTLWILGDLLFQPGTKLALLRRIPGNVKVVLGNHDGLRPDVYASLGFRVYGAAYGKQGILFTHIPVHPGQKDRFSLNVHGHLHDKVIPDPWYFNVCLEQNNLKPFNIEEIYEKIPLLPDSTSIPELHVSTGLRESYVN